MKTILIIILFLTTNVSYAQPVAEESGKATVARELTVLFDELNTAIHRHDQKTLERIYADEFLFIHSFGYIDDKREQIRRFMESDSVSKIPTPSFDQLLLHGNMAIVRMIVKNPRLGTDLMSTSIYIKREGHWQILQVQSTLQQKERETVMADTRTLEAYTGKYTQNNNRYTFITRDHTSLLAQRQGRPKYPLRPVSDTTFYDRFGSTLTFFRDTAGKVTHFVWKAPNGEESTWTKAD
jgi:hypothetical protein